MNKTIDGLKCCVTECERPLDQSYWNTQWNDNKTGWDIGYASPAIAEYLSNYPDKNASILIPGCGNAYEAEFLVENGFTNITLIDIAPKAVELLKEKFSDKEQIKVLCEDFFLHQGSYDLIIEQTFFCALPPRMRQKYVWKIHQLLNEKGVLAGLLFNREFEINPPFGGNKTEYEQLFQHAFEFQSFDVTDKSIPARVGSELFIEFSKNDVLVNLYAFEGITCNGCMNTVSGKFLEIEDVLNISMSSDFSEVIIVSRNEIEVTQLQEIVSYDEKYKIVKVA